MLQDDSKSAASIFGNALNKSIPDIFLNNGDVIDIGRNQLKVINTPGHTKGSICLMLENEKILFTGDTIFKDGYGRTDMYGGDNADLIKSLEIIKSQYREYKAFPGHGVEFIM